MNEFERLKSEFEKVKSRSGQIRQLVSQIKNFVRNNARNFFDLPEKERVGLNGIAEMIAFCSKVRMQQLHKFFNELKRIIRTSTNIKNDLQRLVPLLVYARGRGVIDDLFFEVVQTLIDNCEDRDKEKLIEFMEAIIAFHKFHGK